MSSGINLLGTKKKGVAKPLLKRLVFLRFSAMIILFSISVFSAILFILITLSPLPQLRRQEALGISALAQSKDDVAKVSILNERMNTITVLLAQRNTYDQTLMTIASYLPGGGGIKITAYSLSKDQMSVTVGSDSLQLMDTFINGLVGAVQQKKDFSHITLSNLTLDSEKNQFSLTLLLQPL